MYLILALIILLVVVTAVPESASGMSRATRFPHLLLIFI